MDDRLISFNAAIDALEKGKPTPFVNKDGSVDPFGAGRQNQWYRDGIAIMNLPTVDAVPVVRCRDCEHKDRESGFCHGRGWPMQLVPDDGFCDKGKGR